MASGSIKRSKLDYSSTSAKSGLSYTATQKCRVYWSPFSNNVATFYTARINDSADVAYVNLQPNQRISGHCDLEAGEKVEIIVNSGSLYNNEANFRVIPYS